MNSGLALQYKGFLKFISRASNELRRWFGPHCNDDTSKIAFMAAREWEGMDDHEKKHFIKAHVIDSRKSDSRPPKGSNSFICYLLEKRSAELAVDQTPHECFNPIFAKSLGESWRSLSDEERQKYSHIKIHDLGIDHVLEKRDKLHQIYNPRELSSLEFILKTKPRHPMSPRMWFFSNENLSINSEQAKDRWIQLDQEEKVLYNKCAMLDKKRYNFEKSVWLTNLLKIDFHSDDFTLKDFAIPSNISQLDKIGSMIELSKDIPESLIGLKRPRGPFSLFIEAYRYQTRDKRPEFQFSKHLRECSEAWAKLSDAEKQYYKDASKELRENRKKFLKEELKLDQYKTLSLDYFNTYKTVHGPCRPLHLVPKVPSAMSIWADRNNVVSKGRRSLWNNLTNDEKRPYLIERERLRDSAMATRQEILKKLEFVEEMINRSKELEKLKRRYCLIRKRKKLRMGDESSLAQIQATGVI